MTFPLQNGWTVCISSIARQNNLELTPSGTVHQLPQTPQVNLGFLLHIEKSEIRMQELFG